MWSIDHLAVERQGSTRRSFESGDNPSRVLHPASVGVKVSLITSTCDGWIASMLRNSVASGLAHEAEQTVAVTKRRIHRLDRRNLSGSGSGET